MILAIILALIAIALIVLVLSTVVVGGAAFIVVFGDVIVCIAILIWIIRKLTKKRY